MSLDAGQGDLHAGVIDFADSFRPELPDGTYELVVGQRVQISGEADDSDGVLVDGDIDEQYVNRTRFRIEGPQFVLAPDDVRAVFPPPDSLGKFEDVLPHIVLERQTLPWERTAAADPGDPDDPPWLAILVLHPDDEGAGPAPAPWPSQRIPASELRSRPDCLAYPDLDLDAALSDVTCQVIDLPVGLWERVAPSFTELPLLAHSRSVETSSDASGSVASDGKVAVVVANRLARPNGQSTAHLVSLEGLEEHLPGGPSRHAGHTSVRLVSLRSWTFTSEDPTETFIGLLQSLDVGPLRIPAEPDATSEQPEADRFVEHALDIGYGALDHQTRRGSQIVSWYRGPLVPFVPGADAPFADLVEVGRPVRSADELLRFDEATGLLDTSYAVAWQLGQLLALEDEAFSLALASWRETTVLETAVRFERAFMASKTGSLLGKAAAALPAVDSFAAPSRVTAWLDALRLLDGVPFGHLVPDERMLPPGSMRAFHLDWNWVHALTEGAFSVGRTSSVLAANDAANHAQVQSDGRQLDPISGFLLRSGVVTGWPALRVTAQDIDGRQLEVLRLEHLAPSVLLCLVSGQMSRIRLAEPPEGLHFGIDVDHDPQPDARRTFTKQPRSRGNGGDVAGGHVGDVVPVPLRPDSDDVLEVARLAGVLGANGAAQFALQMVEGVEAMTFDLRASHP